MAISKSLMMQERAKERIAGMTQLLSKRPDMFAPGVWPGYFSKAKGVEIWDLDGNRYTDMSIGGIGANVLGYADPDVNKAVHEAIDAGSSSSLNCPEEVELADLLCEIHPWATKVRFARSGGEAMAIAVRLARAFKGKDKVAFCGYHGWHDWYLAANLGSENALGEHLLPGLSPIGVPRGLTGTAMPFRYNRIEDLEKIISRYPAELAAIVMEPIRSEYPKAGFLEKVRGIARETDAVFIIDEISAGFRMNSGGAHLLFGISPDIAVFSKALGNGFPVAAVIGTGEVMDVAQNTFISSTMWTERVGNAAALATVRKHRKLEAGTHLMHIGKMVQEGWKKAAEKHDIKINVGGIPPLGHFSFEHEKAMAIKALFVQLMLEKGFLASTLFYAMYVHTEKHVTDYLMSVDEVFKTIAEAIHFGNVEGKLLGTPATSGFKRIA